MVNATISKGTVIKKETKLGNRSYIIIIYSLFTPSCASQPISLHRNLIVFKLYLLLTLFFYTFISSIFVISTKLIINE